MRSQAKEQLLQLCESLGNGGSESKRQQSQRQPLEPKAAAGQLNVQGSETGSAREVLLPRTETNGDMRGNLEFILSIIA